MKHIGRTLKEFIESNCIIKKSVADKAGITDNYLSMIFQKATIDCELYERLCSASGMDPSSVFECPSTPIDEDGRNELALALKLLKEKDYRIKEMERTINILMSMKGGCSATDTEQNN